MDATPSDVDTNERLAWCTPERASNQDIVTRSGTQMTCNPHQRQPSPQPPPQLTSICLHSEIHRIEDTAVDAEGWRVVVRWRSRR